MGINWIGVFIRIVEGFLNGTGFVLGLLFWLMFLKWLHGRNEITQQSNKEFFDNISK